MSMSKRRTSRTTLERRGRIFFGAFILLTVVGCLWWPWYQMERLVRGGDPDRAQALVEQRERWQAMMDRATHAR